MGYGFITETLSRRINIYVYQGKFHLVFWILYKCCLHIKSDRTIVLLKLRHHILYKIDLYLMLTTPRFFCCVSYLLMILLLESKETTKNQDSSEIGFIWSSNTKKLCLLYFLSYLLIISRDHCFFSVFQFLKDVFFCSFFKKIFRQTTMMSNNAPIDKTK